MTNLHFLIVAKPMMPVHVGSYATYDEAKADATTLAGDHPHWVVSEAENLKTFRGPILVQVYNHLNREKPVSRFENLETAVKRVWASLTENPILPVTPAEPLTGGLPSSGIPTGINRSNDSGIPSFSMGVGPETTEGESDMARKSAKKEKTERAGRGRSSKFAADAKITVLADKNPKRAGTSAHDRFALYRNGMLVSTFLEKGGTYGDLAWDSAHSFISVG